MPVCGVAFQDRLVAVISGVPEVGRDPRVLEWTRRVRIKVMHGNKPDPDVSSHDVELIVDVKEIRT
jgi:hypothetical protein